MRRLTPISEAVARLRVLVEKSEALDTPDAQVGFFKKATRKQREAYAAHKKASRAVDDLNYKILSMPAASPADILLKIEVAGILIDRGDRPAHPLDRLDRWQPDLDGGICDNAAPALVVAIRSDLTRLFGEGRS